MFTLFLVVYTFIGIVCFSLVKEHYEKAFKTSLTRQEEWVVTLASVFWLITLLMLFVWHICNWVVEKQK